MDSSPASVLFIHSRTRELIRSHTSRLFISLSLARTQKQNDLELAAKIGKNLLDKNHELERRLSEAEKKLTSTEDTISQLQHDLNIRDNLLQIYSRDHQDDDRTSLSSGLISPVPVAGLISDSGDRFSLSSVSCTYLNQKLRELEEENYVLREELAAENEMLVNRLQESQTSQQRLITELGQMRDKYDECLSLFNEARQLGPKLSVENDLEQLQWSRLFRAMDQARQVHEQIECGCARPSSSGKYSEYGPEDNVSSSGCFSGSEPSEKPSAGAHSHTPCSRARIVDTSSHDVCSSPLTMAGVNDETLKRHSWFGSPTIHDDCVNPRRAGPHGELTLQNSLDDNLLLSDSPHIPSSDPSTVYAQSYARLPQRLKLIKPLDGSEVLQQWQRLATPSFTRALFDAPLPGVRGRAGVATIADRRAMSVGAGPWSATDRSTSVQRRDLRNGESGHDNLSQDDQHRFGVGLPSHIMCDGIRSRSLEHLQANTRKFRVPAVTGYPAVGHHPLLGDHPIGRLDRISQPETTGLSSPFSLTSLVSALLPFSLSPNNQPVADNEIDQLTTCEPLPGALKTKNLSCGSTPETEPIRIRPRSPPRSRGLLEVSRIDAETNSVQRVVSATARPNSPSSTISLPGAQPPPASISAQTFIRPSYARTVRNTNLSEITEESGSPPKLSDNTGASQDENDFSPGETSTRCTNVN
ncbi:Trafficking kinesin-binding protein 1 [Fasciola gigantica]|uniref:Trafficking kinesin-binding protein 1 n=1 Tax=Fasciola gigantica TaxID=46835 RepID=A0A504YT73_FASGI|nr:Trafficking kinesin-binding protein 1 [Fasciola gigantica]